MPGTRTVGGGVCVDQIEKNLNNSCAHLRYGTNILVGRGVKTRRIGASDATGAPWVRALFTSPVQYSRS